MNRFLQRLGIIPTIEEKLNLDRASSLTWSQVHHLLRSTFQRRGYSVEAVGSSHAPVDMVLQKGGEKVFLGCHHWQVWEVPDKAVHELAGYASGAGAHHAVMVTSGQFSANARTYAAQRGVELVDGSHLKNFVAGTPSRS
ncbi:MAG TPA: restriction endonuclease [Candidatus Dormibacteraeota bacterium]|nr:restriction endonuclease [Candidatus Dormibacteraeota bacterium]